jgi:hypothetical protein|tara:strand:- start:1409 stop:1546 length:138 start_codon:yes stop_codon:yes gene_type:complete
MARGVNTFTHGESRQKKRPGIHSKNNTSNSKKSKNYKKKYRGQGK